MKLRWETEFKETEIGKIPKDWEISEVAKYYKLKYGITLSSLEYGNCKLLRQTDLKDGSILIENIPYTTAPENKIEEYSLKSDDLVISRIANVGTLGYISQKCLDAISEPLLFGSYLLKFEKVREINNKFVFYFYISSQMQEYIKSIGEGSTRPNTNAKVVSKFPLIIPPLPEQSRIATVLSWFDDLIENKKKQNEILEKTAMAIFKSWFVDFEPFKDQEFVESELGMIPKGWEVKRLGELARIDSGGSAPQKEKYFENGYLPFIRVKHLSNNVCVSEFDLINDIAVNDYGLKLYSEGSIVFQRSGESLKEARVNLIPLNSFVVNHLAAIDKSTNKNICFIYCLLKSSLVEIIEQTYAGTSLPYLKTQDIENFSIIIPPEPILQSFHLLVEPLFQKIINNQKQIMLLRKIRDTLLPLLVFGKLRVEEI